MCENNKHANNDLYPEKIHFNGVSYSVQASLDREGLIEYFNLTDETGEIVFEADYGIDTLSEDEIIETVKSLSNIFKVPSDVADENEAFAQTIATLESEIRTENGIHAGDDTDDLIIKRIIESSFDKEYPFYARFGVEFRERALELLYMFRNESKQFNDICLDELADEYEDIE